MIRDLGDRYRMFWPKSFVLSFRNVLSLQARDFVPTSEVLRRHTCVYCTTFCC
jgi:hypothetical protein